MLRSLLILPCAAFFAWLGSMALRHPRELLRGFGIEVDGVDGMNEIRAVYGGFPLVMSLGLLLSLWRVELRVVVPLAVAFAMLGMAVGRLISIAADHSAGRLPIVFLAVEALVAAALVAAVMVPNTNPLEKA
jgi:hypothetical protein